MHVTAELIPSDALPRSSAAMSEWVVAGALEGEAPATTASAAAHDESDDRVSLFNTVMNESVSLEDVSTVLPHAATMGGGALGGRSVDTIVSATAGDVSTEACAATLAISIWSAGRPPGTWAHWLLGVAISMPFCLGMARVWARRVRSSAATA